MADNTKNKKITIIQEVMKQYRVPFYHHLNKELQKASVSLKVAYSLPSEKDFSKADNATLPKNYSVVVGLKRLLGGSLIWQNTLREISKSDLIVVEQANKHLINYLLILLSLLKIKRVAFWGHGLNLQARNLSLKERFKKVLVKTPDWWFAYTSETKKYVNSCGFPADKITDVENSIDIKKFKSQLMNVTEEEKITFLNNLGISHTAPLGIYCGALYSEKQLPFLCDALEHIQRSNSDFQFLFIGSGPETPLISTFCKKHVWAHYLGPLFEDDKALCFACCNLMLNPGLVGLGILDCFAAGLPIVTTDYKNHSPEISYLTHQKNGLMTQMDVKQYSNCVIDLLNNNKLLQTLSKGALSSSQHYSIENMAKNFSEGIIKALTV